MKQINFTAKQILAHLREEINENLFHRHPRNILQIHFQL